MKFSYLVLVAVISSGLFAHAAPEPKPPRSDIEFKFPASRSGVSGAGRKYSSLTEFVSARSLSISNALSLEEDIAAAILEVRNISSSFTRVSEHEPRLANDLDTTKLRARLDKVFDGMKEMSHDELAVKLKLHQLVSELEALPKKHILSFSDVQAVQKAITNALDGLAKSKGVLVEVMSDGKKYTFMTMNMGNMGTDRTLQAWEIESLQKHLNPGRLSDLEHLAASLKGSLGPALAKAIKELKFKGGNIAALGAGTAVTLMIGDLMVGKVEAKEVKAESGKSVRSVQQPSANQ